MLKWHIYLPAYMTLIVLLTLVAVNPLSLNFFILFPATSFPVFFICQQRSIIFSFLSFLLFGAIYFIGLQGHVSLENSLLVIAVLLLISALLLYDRSWRQKEAKEAQLKVESQSESSLFAAKYQTRLDSLKHLEKQVTGLLELFEIARDFSEYLSYKGLCEILNRRVKPLFDFREMVFFLALSREGETPQYIRHIITDNGITQNNDPPTLADEKILSQLDLPVNNSENADLWTFPLQLNETTRSFLTVEGAQKNDLAKFEVLSAFLKLQLAKIQLYNHVKELAIRDSLTGLFVRRHFLERFEEELKRSVKYSHPLAVLMLDIDHFKRYNDEYGHLAGDATLKQVGAILLQSLRGVDIVARYGGEEFIVVIPEISRERALEVAERIRSSIARNTFKIYDVQTRVTASIGLALFQAPEDSEPVESFSALVMDLIQKADKALYRAKEEGRNQVCLHPN